MLENVQAATGGLPPKTGNTEIDYENLRMFLDRFLRVTERNNEKILALLGSGQGEGG